MDRAVRPTVKNIKYKRNKKKNKPRKETVNIPERSTMDVINIIIDDNNYFPYDDWNKSNIRRNSHIRIILYNLIVKALLNYITSVYSQFDYCGLIYIDNVPGYDSVGYLTETGYEISFPFGSESINIKCIDPTLICEGEQAVIRWINKFSEIDKNVLKVKRAFIVETHDHDIFAIMFVTKTLLEVCGYMYLMLYKKGTTCKGVTKRSEFHFYNIDMLYKNISNEINVLDVIVVSLLKGNDYLNDFYNGDQIGIITIFKVFKNFYHKRNRQLTKKIVFTLKSNKAINLYWINIDTDTLIELCNTISDSKNKERKSQKNIIALKKRIQYVICNWANIYFLPDGHEFDPFTKDIYDIPLFGYKQTDKNKIEEVHY